MKHVTAIVLCSVCIMLLVWSLASRANELEVLVMRPGEARACKDAQGCILLTVPEVRELVQEVHRQTLVLCGRAI